jgi:hypothetical protein
MYYIINNTLFVLLIYTTIVLLFELNNDGPNESHLKKVIVTPKDHTRAMKWPQRKGTVPATYVQNTPEKRER